MANDKNLGQESNQNWDDQNDQRPASNQPGTPNPERFEDANLGQGSGSLAGQNERFEEAERDEKNEKHHHGSAFNEEQGPAVGAGTSQRGERDHAGPLDADLEPLPSEKRRGNV